MTNLWNRHTHSPLSWERDKSKAGEKDPNHGSWCFFLQKKINNNSNKHGSDEFRHTMSCEGGSGSGAVPPPSAFDNLSKAYVQENDNESGEDVLATALSLIADADDVFLDSDDEDDFVGSPLHQSAAPAVVPGFEDQEGMIVIEEEEEDGTRVGDNANARKQKKKVTKNAPELDVISGVNGDPREDKPPSQAVERVKTLHEGSSNNLKGPGNDYEGADHEEEELTERLAQMGQFCNDGTDGNDDDYDDGPPPNPFRTPNASPRHSSSVLSRNSSTGSGYASTGSANVGRRGGSTPTSDPRARHDILRTGSSSPTFLTNSYTNAAIDIGNSNEEGDEGSQRMPCDIPASLPLLHLSEIQCGEVLGSGAFCTVRAVAAVRCRNGLGKDIVNLACQERRDSGTASMSDGEEGSFLGSVGTRNFSIGMDESANPPNGGDGKSEEKEKSEYESFQKGNGSDSNSDGDDGDNEGPMSEECRTRLLARWHLMRRYDPTLISPRAKHRFHRGRYPKPLELTSDPSKLPPPRFALKRVRSDLNREDLERAMLDMDTEVRVLIRLGEFDVAAGNNNGKKSGSRNGHPNIIGLHGVGIDLHQQRSRHHATMESSGSMDDNSDHFLDVVNTGLRIKKDGTSLKSNGTENDLSGHRSLTTQLQMGRFLILDRLNGTLANRIIRWRKDLGAGLRARNAEDVWLQRIVCLTKIAGAIGFLHSRGVIYRDLKPDNVGFDSDDVPKLFDFGLARTFDVSDKYSEDDDDVYNLTGDTGSRRYMPPEVALCQPYGTSADVYSLSIVMHEVLSLKKPFAGIGTSSKLLDSVTMGGKRPPLDKSWPVELSKLLTSMWDSNRRKRPKSAVVVAWLEEFVRGPDAELFPSRGLFSRGGSFTGRAGAGTAAKAKGQATSGIG